MRVNPSANNASIDQVRTAAEAPKQAATSAAAATSSSDSLARSSDLTRLLSTLAELPDVREDVLAMVRAKLEAGELAQKSAVAAAAAGIVDGAE